MPRYIELPSAVILSVKVTVLLPLAACSSVMSEVKSFVVLAGFLCSFSFFERIILPFCGQYSTKAAAEVSTVLLLSVSAYTGIDAHRINAAQIKTHIIFFINTPH